MTAWTVVEVVGDETLLELASTGLQGPAGPAGADGAAGRTPHLYSGTAAPTTLHLDGDLYLHQSGQCSGHRWQLDRQRR